MPNDDEYKLPDGEEPKKKRGNEEVLRKNQYRGGRPKGAKSKSKPPPKPTGIPARSEWREVSRLVLNGLVEQLQDRDEEGRLTANSAMYRAASDLVKEAETLYKEDEKDIEEHSEFKKSLEQKRKNRKLRISDEDIQIHPMPSMNREVEMPISSLQRKD